MSELFPAYARTDAKHIAKWRHLLFILTGLWLPRVVIGFSWFGSSALYGKIFMTGHDRSKPMTGLRYQIIRYGYALYCWSLTVVFGLYRLKKEDKHDLDYSYYLGPDYKKN